MVAEWDGPSWEDAPAGYDPERDRRWTRAWIRAPRWGSRRWIRLRRKLALLATRIADRLQP